MENHDAEIEFEAVLNTLVDGVIIIDAVGTMRLFNPACTKIFGYEANEVVGKNVKMLMPEPYHGEHDQYLKSYGNTKVKKIIGIGRDMTGLKKNGATFPMDLSVGESSLNGRALYVGVIRDLTERHKRKFEYDHLQEEYFHLSRVSAMNEMGSAIAHELNQPLAASINFMETMRLLLLGGTDFDHEKLLKANSRAIEQAVRASEIIKRMREFIERGDVTKTSCSLEEIIQTAIRLAFLSFKSQQVIVDISLEPDLPPVFVNSIQIQQVLVNLMKNACEAMMDREEKRLEIMAQIASCGKQIEVQIKDTGHGLTDQDIEKLFVPFSSTKSEGMGIGLSISQSIISYHGGQIWARKNEPTGSVFHFTLPIASPGER